MKPSHHYPAGSLAAAAVRKRVDFKRVSTTRWSCSHSNQFREFTVQNERLCLSFVSLLSNTFLNIYISNISSHVALSCPLLKGKHVAQAQPNTNSKTVLNLILRNSKTLNIKCSSIYSTSTAPAAANKHFQKTTGLCEFQIKARLILYPELFPFTRYLENEMYPCQSREEDSPLSRAHLLLPSPQSPLNLPRSLLHYSS